MNIGEFLASILIVIGYVGVWQVAKSHGFEEARKLVNLGVNLNDYAHYEAPTKQDKRVTQNA